MVKKIFLILSVIVSIIFIISFLYFFIDDQGSCNSDGKVWDNINQTCRNDCITWNQEQGCLLKNPID